MGFRCYYTFSCLYVSCRSSSVCSAVCLCSLYLSVITHTAQLNDGPVEIHWGGYLTQDFPIIGLEASQQQIVVFVVKETSVWRSSCMFKQQPIVKSVWSSKNFVSGIRFSCSIQIFDDLYLFFKSKIGGASRVTMRLLQYNKQAQLSPRPNCANYSNKV